jgi:hypothetical protein
MKLEFSEQVYEKSLHIKSHQNALQDVPSCYMRMDTQDEADSRFSQFCERSWGGRICFAFLTIISLCVQMLHNGLQRNPLRLFIVSFNPTYMFRPPPAETCRWD